jgi:hypothetical protein
MKQKSSKFIKSHDSPTTTAKNEIVTPASQSRDDKRRTLPAPKPGVIVTVPLAVLSRYLEFFHRVPIAYGWSDLAEDDVLTVKKEDL